MGITTRLAIALVVRLAYSSAPLAFPPKRLKLLKSRSRWRFSSFKTWTKNFHKFNSNRSLKLLGYDTLEGTNWNSSTSGAGVDSLRSQTLSLVSRSQSIFNRVEAALDGLGMSDHTQLTNEQCERLAEAGLVVELLLQPMYSLRDIKRWMIEKDII